MRRALSLVAVVAALRAAPARADPLDVDLARLGAPTAPVWEELARRHPELGLDPADAGRLASESRRRFALLATQLGLALSSFIQSPAATTGTLGYELDLELAWAPVDDRPVGDGAPGFPATGAFPARGGPPNSLLMPALHVRKALLLGLELGGRAILVARSTMVAVQAEAKWAVNESWWYLPDFAIRAAYTRLLSQRQLDLTTLDLDLLAGRRFGVAGLAALTPYGAFRLTWLGARTTPVDFGPNLATPGPADPNGGAAFPDARDPATLLATQAAFPELRMSRHLLPRVAVGLRLAVPAAALSVSLEACYLPSKTFAGPAEAPDGVYPRFTVPASLSASGRAGVEF